MSELYKLTIEEAGKLLRARKLSSVELTQAHLDRIRAVDRKVRAFTLVTDDLALKQAQEADRRIYSGENVTPLTGIPLGIKDVICTKDITTTCGSRMLENFKPPFNAAVMEKLNAAGVGELGEKHNGGVALGSFAQHSALFPAHKPPALPHPPHPH